MGLRGEGEGGDSAGGVAADAGPFAGVGSGPAVGGGGEEGGEVGHDGGVVGGGEGEEREEEEGGEREEGGEILRWHCWVFLGGCGEESNMYRGERERLCVSSFE